jgi:ribosomal protein S12 methylthiotransferase accessory factor
MQMTITFPGGDRVEAEFDGFTVKTDQPPNASAPSPFELFLASVGTCAGVYVLNFLHQRSLPTEGLRIQESIERGADGLVTLISLEVQLPAGIPEKYRPAIIRAAQACTVKKHLAYPPEIEIHLDPVLT